MLRSRAVSPTVRGNNGDDDKNDDFQRVDEPPHESSEPECPDTGGERDSLWLYVNMPAEPSLAFEQQETTSVVLLDEGLGTDFDESNSQFYAALLTADADLDRLTGRSRPRQPDSLRELTSIRRMHSWVRQGGGPEASPHVSNGQGGLLLWCSPDNSCRKSGRAAIHP